MADPRPTTPSRTVCWVCLIGHFTLRCRRPQGKRVSDGRWRWHVRHWKIQVQPLQAVRRSLLTRCSWCGGRSRKRDHVNVSHSWDGPRGRWWQGEPGLFHHDCSSLATAHRTCICAAPVIEIPPWTQKLNADDPDRWPLTRPDHGTCVACRRFRRAGVMEPSAVAAYAVQQTVPKGQRPNPEQAAEIKAAWAVYQTEQAAVREAERVIEDASR